MVLAPRSENEMKLICEATNRSGMSVEAHLTLMPHLDRPIQVGSGSSIQLGEEPFEIAGSEDARWIEHAGWRVSLPRGARLIWPALPHNPYRKGGEATTEEARLVVVLPFPEGVSRYEVMLEVEG